MFVFDLTNPLTLLLVVMATALLIFLGQEIKRSSVAIIPLIAFLGLLIIHVVQVASLGTELAYLSGKIYKCIALDLLLILITFFTFSIFSIFIFPSLRSFPLKLSTVPSFFNINNW